jgi:hypothetical protein
MNIFKIIAVSYLLLAATFHCKVSAQVVPVTIQGSVGSFEIMRNGNPYFVKGAGGDKRLDVITLSGGNSVRTWGTDSKTIDFLDQAEANGLTVLMGLWVGHEAHGFNYNDAVAVNKQLDEFRNWVRLYKDHPAVLAWAIGNEVELGVSNYNLKVWNAINDIALMIQQEDGNHPTLTVVAGIDIQKTQHILERAPNLDLIGVNAYGGIGGVDQTLQNGGWNKPYLITEWGPNGQWESQTTNWGEPIETSSTDKAALYKSRYQNFIAPAEGRCVGSYVFLWADKMEETPTWYGLFLPKTQEKTQAVEEMQFNWTGFYPANRAPKIISATVAGKASNQNPVIKNDIGNVVTIEASDPENDPLQYEYIIQSDDGRDMITSNEFTLSYIPGLITSIENNTATFNAPQDKKSYRLFIFVRDGQGNAATINVPFQVNLDPLVSLDPNIVFASKDCYVRDGEFQTNSFGLSNKEQLQTRLADDVGNNREAYVGFNIQNINTKIVRVYLELFGNGPEGAKVSVYPLKRNDWTETMAWSNKKITSLSALDTITLLAGSTQYYQWDVTNYVNNERYSGEDSVSFILKNISISSNPANWLSRESRPFPPRLVFTLEDGEIILSAGENEIDQAVLFPNPATSVLYIRTQQVPSHVNFMDSRGVVLAIQSVQIENNLFEFQVSDLPSGLYTILFERNNKIGFYRFIKN